MSRDASFIGAPELVLFPKFFGARSVLFRAGLELSVMNGSLRWLGVMRRLRLIPSLKTFLKPLRFLARQLTHICRDSGAMMVEVTGPTVSDGEHVTHRWTLLADPGEGPFVPTIVARALLRNPKLIKPGARPCLAELPLQSYMDATADIGITTSVFRESKPPLFRAALGHAWHQLTPQMQTLNNVQDCESFSGRARVERGSSVLARLAGVLLRFPKASQDVPIRVTKTRTATGETWVRDFTGRRMRSHLTSPGPGRVCERFGSLNFELELGVEDSVVHWPVRQGWFLGFPLPKCLLPISKTREFTQDDVFQFDVGLYLPITGALIVAYRGWLQPECGRDSDA